jgi:hypothetical protein
LFETLVTLVSLDGRCEFIQQILVTIFIFEEDYQTHLSKESYHMSVCLRFLLVTDDFTSECPEEDIE